MKIINKNYQIIIKTVSMSLFLRKLAFIINLFSHTKKTFKTVYFSSIYDTGIIWILWNEIL